MYLNLITYGDKTANFVSVLASYIFEVQRPLTMPARIIYKLAEQRVDVFASLSERSKRPADSNIQNTSNHR